MCLMNKETRLNLRITPEFKSSLQSLADFHGLQLSSYVHSIFIPTHDIGRAVNTVFLGIGGIVGENPVGKF